MLGKLPFMYFRYSLLIITFFTLSISQDCLVTHQFYDHDTSLCAPCPTTCLTCFSALACSSCVSQFFLNQDSECAQCLFGCAVCNNATSCVTCNEGLYIDSKGNCLSCAQGVKSCTIAMVESCKTGYFFLGSICAGCLDSCDTCQDFVTCTLCSIGHYLSPTQTQCLACPSNCQVCQNSTTCTSCAQGFTLASGSCSIADCTSISPFCSKCSGSVCVECSNGKYLDQSGNCKQGASLLCLTSTGPYYTNCDTSSYGCPSYSSVQTSIVDGTQMPVCSPLSATQQSEYFYSSPVQNCAVLSQSACSTGRNQTMTFETRKPYYKLSYRISLKIYSTSSQNISVKYYQSNQLLTQKKTEITLSNEFAQNLVNSLCFSCQYGYTKISGEFQTQLGTTQIKIQVQTASYHEISEILIISYICQVENCAQCTTSIDCTSCLSPYYLQGVTCVSACSSGYYTYQKNCVLTCPTFTYPIQSSYLCNACVSPCLACLSQNQCLSCVVGYFLDSYTCTLSCLSSQYFTNFTSSLCQPCPNPCTTCEVQNVGSNWEVVCTGCSVGYLLDGGSCTYVCPWGTFYDYVNDKTICNNCGGDCGACGIGATVCTACNNPFLLYNTVCYSNFTCPAGYFSNSGNNSCQSCKYPCLECEQSSRKCTSCAKGALFNGTCVLVCPNGYYSDEIGDEQVCLACVGNCKECLDTSVCTACITGTYLSNSQCVSNCPNTHYPLSTNNTCITCNPPCLTCSSASVCLSCSTGYLISSTFTCTLQCPTGTYPSQNFICISCTSPCKSCFSSSVCTQCSLPYVLHNEGCISQADCTNLGKYVENYKNITGDLSIIYGECLDCTYPCDSCDGSGIVCTSCVTGYLFVEDLDTCLSECPQNYYVSGSNCLVCSSNCLTCVDSNSKCLSCGTAMYLYNSQCLMNCPDQYYANNQNQICSSCELPCKTCLSPYICLSCTTGILYVKSCVSSCPQYSLLVVATNTCEVCTPPCLNCENFVTQCTQCGNGYYLYQGQCLTQCEQQFYGDDLTRSCEACGEPCKTCESATACSTCVNGYYLMDLEKSCVTACPDGYFSSSASCLPCNSTICLTCSVSANNCTKCSEGYYYHSATSSCVQICPAGTYPSTAYSTCQTCTYPCKVCPSSTSCEICQSNYYLFNGYCYSSCPRGYYSADGTTCTKCLGQCEVCENLGTCLKCMEGYYLNAGACVEECPDGLYQGFHALSSYPICELCPDDCLTCLSEYLCETCTATTFLFNNLCVSQCPSLYFPLVSPSRSCETCPQYCNKCTSKTICTQCLNSYMYNNLCYESCPSQTYSSNQQCVLCSEPCVTCVSEFSCLSCGVGMIYYENYCVEKCPADVWYYVSSGECRADCPYNKYVEKMQCYVSGCGGMLVQQGGYCLQGCPDGYYVDLTQNCILCQSQTQCKNLFSGDMQILRSYNLKSVIYLNQPIDPLSLNKSVIQIYFISSSTKVSELTYIPQQISVDNNRIVIQFGYLEIELQTLFVKIPYVGSLWTEQSISYNLFQAEIYDYDNYQYEDGYKTLSTTSNRLTQSTQTIPNQAFKPSTIVNILAIAIVSILFVCLVINIICKGVEYRQLLDFLQFIAATQYLQIQYPPILTEYLQFMRISLFSFMPQLVKFQMYAFSASKFIEFNHDTSLLRSQGVLLIVFLVLLILMVVLIIINKVKSELLVNLVCRIKFRNITDLFSICSLPLLIFCFRTSHSQPADIAFSAITVILIIGYLAMSSYLLITAKTLKQIDGLAGELEHTQNVLGHMYTPFSFIRKIVFALVLCIQPQKPISTLTLLLIFTILIMSCLFFYQPFQNQITDYVCIGMEVALILYVIVIILFGLDALSGVAGHNLGIFAVSVVIVGALTGLIWLVYLTFKRVLKFKKQIQENSEKQEINVQGEILRQDQVETIKVNSKGSDKGQTDELKGYHDEPSANQLIKNTYNNGYGNVNVNGVQSHSSSDNGQQFKHWNNSESSQNQSENRPPKYLLKVQLEHQET